MKRASRFFLYVLAFVIFPFVPALAQSSATSTESSITPYDLSKEIKVQGTIQKIEVGGATPQVGTHILIQTSQGVVDAQLGFGAAAAPANLGISDGSSVTIVGMMQSQGGNSVLLARILTTSSGVFVLRSERGVPVRATPAGNFHASSTLKGAQ